MGASIPEIYEKVTQGIGKAERRPLGVVRQRDLQRFAVAGDDLNPAYFDESFAKAARLPGIAAPPLFLSSVLIWEPGPFEQSRSRTASRARKSRSCLSEIRRTAARPS